MERLKTYRMPLRSKTLRGKKYSILVLQDEDKYGKRTCTELVLTSIKKETNIIFIKDSEKPCSRSMWKSFYCVVKDKDLSFNKFYQIIDKERYPVPEEFSIITTGLPKEEMDAILTTFTQKEKQKLRRAGTVLHLAVSDSTYQWMKEVV